MAFKPKQQSNSKATTESDNPGGLYPVPKKGSRKARISLIVDLGEQEREDFEDPKTKEKTPQKPCQQVAVFADLTADNVDYGGKIGKAHYRLLLNNSFAGDIKGINFTSVPPRDADGNMIKGKDWGFHPASPLTKLAKAVNKPEVITSMDLEELLDCPFMATVEIKETESDKEDSDGNPIIWRNVNYKGCSEVMLDDDDEPINVPELNMEAKCITFDNATVEDIQFIRKKLIAMIKQARDYAGSNMQKAIEAFEKKNNSAVEESYDEEEDEAPPKKKVVKEEKKPTTKKKAPVVEDDSDDEDEQTDDDSSPF